MPPRPCLPQSIRSMVSAALCMKPNRYQSLPRRMPGSQGVRPRLKLFGMTVRPLSQSQHTAVAESGFDAALRSLYIKPTLNFDELQKFTANAGTIRLDLCCIHTQ